MASAIALFFCPADIRAPVAWCGFAAVVLTVVTSVGTARRLRVAEAARHTRASAEAEKYYEQREAALLARLDDQRAATVWLTEELLPAAMDRLQKGEPASEIMNAVSFGEHLDGEFTEALGNALAQLLEFVETEEFTRDASERALVAVARRMQAIVHQLSKDLHAMQILHGNDHEVSRGLRKVDHRNALIGRLAANIAVLGDARPGRQWSKAIVLYDILRGAMSRIVDFPRVKLHSVAEVAVVGPGAEPLTHMLAELLDNATTFSPPNTPVVVTASEVPSGIAIEIEDRGVGLTEEVRERVERVMEQSRISVNLSGLGEMTQIGLPVVSRLAREHGCEVDLRTSAYGGVRAVVLVPRDLITTAPPSSLRFPVPARRPPGGPVPPRPAPAVDTAASPAEPAKTANGLPQRRRDSPVLPQRRRESPVPVPIVSMTPTPPAAPTGRADSRPPGLMWEAFTGVRKPDAEPATSTDEPSDEDE
ncbi:ATP-binding protein [Streptomyces sp. NPDC058664]|uniref:ATP-binding protein n=1 Tax=unclassified Streptomyces TaxID=2593676 RepID=UPI003669929C